KVRVLLADDHETVREGLKAILNRQADMTVVAEAVDGRAAVEQSRIQDPDVAVIDISMPDMNGLKATEAILQSCPRTKVLALTRHEDLGYLQQLLRAGVSGYILKQSRSTELLQAIRAVAAGGKYLDSALAGRVMADFTRPTAAHARVAGHPLSPREEEILRFCAWGQSNKEIAARLTLGVKTVETHKANAMQKLGLRSRMDVVRYAVLQGWLKDE
ncbi:MAG TPA: response regulator transcription factor, partial [Nitrospira sp.]|nr:response regulator transcription factor [Nitrospira sp.]